LNIEEKLKILGEKETQMKEISKKNKKANTAWCQYRIVYCHPNYHFSKRNNNSSNINIIEISFEYYYYKSTEYYIINCEF